MKRKSLTAKRKVSIKKQIKNRKIKDTFNQFKKIIFKNIKKESFAIAVSGGADSLCLAYFSQIYASEFKNNVTTLIVNHNLRNESSKEANEVKKILKSKNIKSKILSWQGKIPKKNIQGNARNIRYSLLSKYCYKNKIKFLVTAHHLDDQIENFFIRLFRGSGIKGLSSMAENIDYKDNLKIVRPFLNLKKNNLKCATLDYFKTYIKDPSNDNEKFLRVRVRKYRDIMKKEGLDSSKIIKTINNLFSANKALNFYKNKALYKHATFLSKGKCFINKQIFFDEANEIIFKLFSDVLSLISGDYYPPRSKKIMNLILRLKKSSYTKSTLGGCVIEKKEGFILISRELKAKKVTQQLSR